MVKKNISEILPEGLSEASVNEIARVVEDTIDERVSEEIKGIEAKVKAFIRLKIEELKEHALLELQEENTTYRNSKLFEHMKSVVALELGQEDEGSTVASLLEEKSVQEAERVGLAERLSKALEENENISEALAVTNAALAKSQANTKILEEDNDDLKDEVSTLTESNKRPFKSSEKAVIISENSEVVKERKVNNPFLTPEVMEHMPFTSKK